MRDWLDEMAASREAMDRKRAISSLLSMERDEALKRVQLWIDNDDPLVRQTAVLAVAELFEEREGWKTLIRKAMEDESWLVREAIARTIRSVRKERDEAFRVLMDLARDESPGVNRSAGDTLAEFMKSGDVPWFKLEELASSDFEGERRTAAFTLRRLHNRGWMVYGREALNVLRDWASADWRKKWTTLYACKLIGKKESLTKEIIVGIEDERLSKLKKKALREIDDD